MSNDSRVGFGMNSEFDTTKLADALTYAGSILREGATDEELVDAVMDICLEVGMVEETTPQEQAVDELIDARVSLMRLGMSFEVQGNEHYHDAYRSISRACGLLGLSTTYLAELADARLALCSPDGPDEAEAMLDRALERERRNDA